VKRSPSRLPILAEKPTSGRNPGLAEMAMMQRDLVKRAAGGDQEAFETLVRLSAGRLFAIAYRVLRDHDLAEDALQQALATIWNDLPRLRDPDRFEAWGYRLIVRASVAQARRERRGGPVVHLLPDDADAITARGPDEFDRIADRDQLERGFRRLTPDQRAVLVLQYYVGLSLAEIADVLGIPIGTAGSRLPHASRALRAALDADDRSESPRERTA
jgi:RNA polymerase sigma-70 factor (ECF subfamily)